jgi:hypothetical protein
MRGPRRPAETLGLARLDTRAPVTVGWPMTIEGGGVTMRHGLWACVVLAALLAAAPAFAFQVKSAATDGDGTAKFTNPENLSDRTANDPSGGNGRTLHFGSTTVTVGTGNGATSSGMAPALQERLMLGPYAVGTGAQLR